MTLNNPVTEQIQLGCKHKTTFFQTPRMTFSEKGTRKTLAGFVPEENIKMENTERQDNLVNGSHSSSSASSCNSFLFQQNGTASGFIKIYGPNHHWKYKTLVGAQGEMGEEGEQAVRKKDVRWLEKTGGGGDRRQRQRSTDKDKHEGILGRADVSKPSS